MCQTGKIEYQSAGQARNAWAKMNRHRSRGSKTTPILRPYQCQFCPFWHLTSWLAEKPRLH